MEPLQTLADYLRKELANVENKIADLKTKTEKETIRQKVMKMSSKFGWEKFVDRDYGLVDNVSSLAEESYDILVEECFPSRKEGQKVLGKLGSELWETFLLKVFQKLIDDNAFDLENGEYDDFGDTAGGCDETLWNACVSVLDPN